MKILANICIALTLVLTYSCVTNIFGDSTILVDSDDGHSKLKLSLSGLRTHIGESEDGTSYPLLWSEGDKISVNGVVSNALTADEAGGSNAVFTFDAEMLEAPYCVAYPAAEAGRVLFAANQNYVGDSSFERGVVTMCGYGENEKSIRLRHLTGILKIGVVGSATIKSAQISTIDRAPIAGAFNVDFESGRVEPSEAAEEIIVYSFGDGVVLNEDTPTYIHVAVPEGIYDELYVTLFDSKGGVMCTTVRANENKPLLAGKIRIFRKDNKEQNILYKANKEQFIIRDFASLIEFRNLVNLGNFTKDAILVKDVVVPANDATLGSISGDKYTGILNGNGYAIKGLEYPLFYRMSGSIKGLHLKDVKIGNKNHNTRAVGALVDTYTGTSITHCSVSGEITLTRDLVSENYIAGIVGSLDASRNCEISNCESDCRINIRIDDTSKSSSTFVAGVVAQSKGSSANVTISFKNNTNRSAITVEGSANKSNLYVGGIVANVGTSSSAVFDGCCSSGDIVVNLNIVQTVLAGGVIADYYRTSSESGCSLLATNCANSGTIYYSLAKESKVADTSITYYTVVGGCFGRLEDGTAGKIVVDNCDNCGNVEVKVEPSSTRILSRLDIGGIAGCVRGQAEVRNCENRASELTLVANKPNKNFTIGGLFGRLTSYADTTKPVSLRGCANHSDVTLKITEDTGIESYIGGAIGQMLSELNKSYKIELDDVDNYGSVTSVATNLVTNATTTSTYMAGIVGAFAGGTSFTGANNKAASSQCVIKGCDNAVIESAASRLYATGGKYRILYAAGVIGYANAPLTMEYCSNSMPYLYDARVTSNYNYYGGAIAKLNHNVADLTTKIENFANSGVATIVAKESLSDLIVSGVVGYLDDTNMMTLTAKNITNRATINTGGLDAGVPCVRVNVAGIVGKMGAYNKASYDFANVANAGDINVVNLYVSNSANAYIGGVAANLTKSLSGVKSLCNIKAYMFDSQSSMSTSAYDNVGAVTGSARTSDVKLINVLAGGTITVSAKRNTQGVVQDNVVMLDADNYFNYLYGVSVAASVASEDGCGYISSL